MAASEAKSRESADHAMVERQAMALFDSDWAFACLRAIAAQRFDCTPILTMTELGYFGECPTSARGRYARHFRILQRTLPTAPGGAVRKGVSIVRDCRDGKVSGYVPYCLCADRIGTETVHAFCHRILGKVVLIVSPSEEHGQNTVDCLSDLSAVTRFERSCACCGVTMGGLKKCPCKAVRYCDAACQRLHWGAHRLVCLH
jgi:hypothetical protein